LALIVRPRHELLYTLDTSHSARNLGFIFDEHLTFSDQIIYLTS